jgi:hypothetical protein
MIKGKESMSTLVNGETDYFPWFGDELSRPEYYVICQSKSDINGVGPVINDRVFFGQDAWQNCQAN